MHCSGLEHSVESRPHWSKTSSSDVDAVEHPIQQRRFPAGPGRIERFLQTIGQEVRHIEVDRVVVLPRQRADVAGIDCEIRGKISRDLQRQVLNVGADIMLIVSGDALRTVRDKQLLEWPSRRVDRECVAGDLGEIQVRIVRVPDIAGKKYVARRIADNALDGGKVVASDVLKLIPAADRGPVIQVQSEADGRAKVVQVPRIDFQAGIRTVRPDKEQLARGRRRSSIRPHPVREAASRDSEEGIAVVPQRGRQPVLFPWRTIIVPPHTQVERETVAEFPIIFEEGAPFILMNIANLQWVLEGIVPRFLRLVRTVDETVLAHTTDGSGKENQQVFHPVLVSRRGVASQPRDVRAVDS